MARKQFTTKRERFQVLAENRTNNTIHAIRILSHCSNKSLYEYTSEEIDKIFNAIEEALGEAKMQFKDKKKDRFKL
ncbi:hypothetical protein HYW54_04200 [Candidatus Gottesmanbacteria bacterium]|nr:hypothetical protein [Candidatus Gottesmanbacteria bacterium]